MSSKETKKGIIEIFCAYVIKKGKKIYPKNAKCFHFFLKPKK